MRAVLPDCSLVLATKQKPELLDASVEEFIGC